MFSVKATGLPLSTAFAASSKSLKQDCELFFYSNPTDIVDILKAVNFTLKALENLGYIEIINDGRNFVDTIKLLRTDLLEEVRA